MSNIPTDRQYTETHEWLQKDGDLFIIGITDHAQHQLGDLVFIELPEVGTTFTKGKELGVLESVKAASDFYAPVSGTVTAINERLQDSPALINSAPYDEGWLVKIKPETSTEGASLLDAPQYEKLSSQ